MSKSGAREKEPVPLRVCSFQVFGGEEKKNELFTLFLFLLATLIDLATRIAGERDRGEERTSTKHIMSSSSPPEPPHLDDVYELGATAAWVTAGGHTRVALQMPDELLHDAVAVAAALTRRCNARRGATNAPAATATAAGAAAGARTHAGGVADGGVVKVFVLADTTFGSCCVDEVAAAHHAADCIVHFGRACMSPVSRLPARFVFNKVWGGLYTAVESR
jgi:hypothetical protein